MKRGLEPGLAHQVAEQWMAKDALEAHARDELGISEVTTARPNQAALTSAVSFAAGAAMPLAMVLLMPRCHPGGRCFDRVADFSCAAWLGRCTGRWGKGRQGDIARYLLGRAGDGVDGGSWSDLRDGRLKLRTIEPRRIIFLIYMIGDRTPVWARQTVRLPFGARTHPL